ncbi:hypothetical protein ACP70R_017026 [Stipagrostis hirtigluma subsp. patula]
MQPTSHEDNGKSKDDGFDPWFPPYDPRPPRPADLDIDSYRELVKEWAKRRDAAIAASRATNIIIPDRTPQAVNDGFYDIGHRLFPILRKDSAPLFLRYFEKNSRGVRWGYIITPETFNQMVVHNSLRCAKVALEGQAPGLMGHRANPNCMNQYGYFPLHEAAERFSVDMIKLLLNHGALPSLRTAGKEVIEGLLPLHVAVENTCMHKYLEDNLSPNVDHPDYPTKVDENYIYKLIHLLCLPEMKIFLDTTRLLVEKTDNLLDEIWNYVKDGKVVQTAILLVAAQKHIRGGSSCRTNSDTKLNGFSAIINRIHHSLTLQLGMYQNNEQLQQQQGKIKLMLSTSLLVNIISHAGEAIDACIQRHSEASHAEVLDKVSSILKVYGFYPTGEGIDVENLCPYKLPMPNGEQFEKHGSLVATKVTKDVPHRLTVGKRFFLGLIARQLQLSVTEVSKILYSKDVRKKLPRDWEFKYTRLSFFPYWRSVLASKFPVKVYPAHAMGDRKALHSVVAMPQNFWAPFYRNWNRACGVQREHRS